MRATAVASGLCALFAWAACASVPDIRFVDDGTGTVETSDAGDAAATSSSSSGSNDNGDCEGPPPASGAICCGDTWCVGQCDTTNCDRCANEGCDDGLFCCGKPNTVLCKSRCP
jgi:hypothetical protein